MSKYTTEVRFICENYAGLVESAGYGKIDEVISSARSKVFDFEYPIFDETYRSVLETKILKHFYTREIGAETVGLWKLWMNTRMNEIMPYYNQLYKSELLEFNPLYDFEVTKEHSGTSGGTKKDTGSKEDTKNVSGNSATNGTVSNSNANDSTNNHWDYFNDTPQGGVDNVADLSYLTNARNVTDSSTDTSSGNSTSENENNYTEAVTNSGTNTLESVLSNTEEYLESVKGKQSGTSYAKLLEEYRSTFLNIDMQVINELNDLFMNLW